MHTVCNKVALSISGPSSMFTGQSLELISLNLTAASGDNVIAGYRTLDEATARQQLLLV